ncbi:MAG: hypothetical protein KDA24_13190 [Deltaproteobacteria bacterium]|nr:hypothetical protein [Deltaproteobacteria bacterium]
MRLSIATPLLLTLAIVGCDRWPLHAALPDPVDAAAPDPILASFEEDEVEGVVQDLGSWPAPAILTIRGTTSECGWEDDAAWPTWPVHPVDDDGDGVVDREEARYAGWYSGDVDLFSLRPEAAGVLGGTLEWDNAPAGGTNSPYQPGTDGPWEDESDLDVLVFTAENGAPSEVLTEAGVGRSYPEDLGAAVALDSGENAVIAVGCHHEVPSDWTLEVVISAR